MSIPSAISVKKLFSQTVIRVPTTLPAAFRTGNTAIVILGLASGHEARPRAPLRLSRLSRTMLRGFATRRQALLNERVVLVAWASTRPPLVTTTFVGEKESAIDGT